jgi:hypothetical protein
MAGQYAYQGWAYTGWSYAGWAWAGAEFVPDDLPDNTCDVFGNVFDYEAGESVFGNVFDFCGTTEADYTRRQLLYGTSAVYQSICGTSGKRQQLTGTSERTQLLKGNTP